MIRYVKYKNGYVPPFIILSKRLILILCVCTLQCKETRSVTMNIFRKKNLFESFVKTELSYVFTINMFSPAENCMEK